MLLLTEQVKVVKMLVVVVIIFMLSWLPLYAIFIRIKLGSEKMEAWEDDLLAYATPVAQWLGSSNSAVNPVLYAYFNQKYRRGFTAIIQSGSCCGTIRTTAADFDQRYMTTSEITGASSFGRSRRGASSRRVVPPDFSENQTAGPSATAENGTRNSCKTSDFGRNPEYRSKVNGAVVNTQDSIELNAIHRKWKSQVI